MAYFFYLLCCKTYSNVTKKTNLLWKGDSFCCQTRIRTQTDRTRICSATVTPFGKTKPDKLLG